MSEQRPDKKENVQEQELDRELMLHDPDNGNVHVLNETATVVWRLADGRRTLKDMEKEVRKQFSISDDQDVKGDVERIIRELRETGMID